VGGITTKVRVRAFGRLTELLGSEAVVELDADSKVQDLVYRLRERIGSLREGFLQRYEFGEPELAILLNGRNILALKKLQTPLKEGDVVVLLPPFIGG